MPEPITGSTPVQIILSYSAIGAVLGWLIYEIRDSWKKLGSKVDSKVDKTDCKEFRDEEKKDRREQERRHYPHADN